MQVKDQRWGSLLSPINFLTNVFTVKKSGRTNFCKKNHFIKQGTLHYLTKKGFIYAQENKLVQLRKLHHHKNITTTFLH